jgi:GT2 family glycosyltransferase
MTAIVIVNYRTAALTIDCLKSLAGQVRGARVWVVDNCSGDGSAHAIQTAIDEHGWGDSVCFIAAPRNGGFAAGNNVALRAIFAQPQHPHFVLLLNPDTVVRPGAIDSLVRFLTEHPRVGIVGSRLEHPDGTAQKSAFRFPSVLSELEYGMRWGTMTRLLSRWCVSMPVADQPHRADWVAGASMLIRSEIFESIGYLDEAYFMYYEEVDFCRRAGAAGWECWYVPQSRVIHLVGQASGLATSRRATMRVPLYWFDSRARYFKQHHGRIYRFLADLAWSGGHVLFRLRNLVQRKETNYPPKLLSDFVAYNFRTRVPH